MSGSRMAFFDFETTTRDMFIPANDTNVTNEFDMKILYRNEDPHRCTMKEERCCWICLENDDAESENRIWLKPCKCRGTTKWVHQSCLYRWVDEKQKGDALRPVRCQQCQTQYLMILPNMGLLANILEAIENLTRRIYPFLASGIMIGTIHWSAVSFGAVSLLQIVGPKRGLEMLANADACLLVFGLPIIPTSLMLMHMIRWEGILVLCMKWTNVFIRKYPTLLSILPSFNYQNDNDDPDHASLIMTFNGPLTFIRTVCNSLVLPSIAAILGCTVFHYVENNFHRTILGAITYIVGKAASRIYLKRHQRLRNKNRRIEDYTDENLRRYNAYINASRQQY